MTDFTVHVREGRVPVLVPERFSVMAAVFGPVWLVLHRAWVPAGLVLAVQVAVGALVPDPLRGVAMLGLAVLVGVSAQDMRRFALGLRGFRLAHVVVARDEDAALARLYGAHPGLAAAELGGLRRAAA